MTLLVVAVLLFGLLHLVPAVPAVKAGAQGLLGKAYGPVYGIGSLLLLVLALWAFRQADATFLYEVPDWGRHANFALSLLGFVCLGIFLFRGSWRVALRFPMGLAVVLWSMGHLVANGDVKTAVLFGGLAVAATLHVLLAFNRQADAAIVRKGHNLISVLAGIALYGVAAQAHQVIAGVPLVQLLPQ
jgi:uncharacterized membrane protein